MTTQHIEGRDGLGQYNTKKNPDKVQRRLAQAIVTLTKTWREVYGEIPFPSTITSDGRPVPKELVDRVHDVGKDLPDEQSVFYLAKWDKTWNPRKFRGNERRHDPAPLEWSSLMETLLPNERINVVRMLNVVDRVGIKTIGELRGAVLLEENLSKFGGIGEKTFLFLQKAFRR